MTLDALFIDELSQTSAEQIGAIDVILRHIRKSQITFRGALIVGTIDHTKIKPINHLPFLTSPSTLVLKCYQTV